MIDERAHAWRTAMRDTMNRIHADRLGRPRSENAFDRSKLKVIGDEPIGKQRNACGVGDGARGRLTTEYVKERRAFGKALIELQNTRFVLAEAKTTTTIARTFLDRCIQAIIDGTCDTVLASRAKYWTSDMQCKVIDDCLQLFGGYGYMMEYPIAQMFADARVQRIYAGANEIMKELIARSL